MVARLQSDVDLSEEAELRRLVGEAGPCETACHARRVSPDSAGQASHDSGERYDSSGQARGGVRGVGGTGGGGGGVVLGNSDFLPVGGWGRNLKRTSSLTCLMFDLSAIY